ncbi:MAG: DUF58 domain-containing protein [Planctomycetes bacterium]|nr:DUF58 domain-containing protein [Planctomycetota bacterium]
MRLATLFVGLLALGWGAVHGVRPAFAYGLAHLTVLLVLYAYPRLARRSLVLRRDQSATACEEDAVEVSFELQNRGLLPLLAPEVLDRFPPDHLDPRRARIYPGLSPRSAVQVGYRGVCHGRRGPYLIGPARVLISCPIGLYTTEWTHPATLAPLLVYPALERVPPPELAHHGRAPSVGDRSPRESGEGNVPLGVRDYRPGDSLRRVHWPTLARRGRLAVIEHERQRARRTTLVLDLDRKTLRGLGRQANLEVALRVVAATAAACLDRGDRVALVAEGRETLWLPAGRGNAQLCRILEALAHVRADGERGLPDLLEALTPRLVRGELLYVVVSDLEQHGREVIAALELVASRGCPAHVVLLDPATFPALHQLPEPGHATLPEIAEACYARGLTPYAVKAAQPLGEELLTPWTGRTEIRLTPASLVGAEASPGAEA